MPVNIRRAALDLLEKTLNRGGYSNHLLDSFYSSNPGLKGEDRNLLKNIFFGVLRNLIYLDSLLEKKVNRPLEKLPPMILHSLRIGLYQIIFLERVPPHAAVNESVKLARRFGHKGTAGLVNAVLRKFAGEERGRLLPAVSGDEGPEDLAEKTSHPLWQAEKYFADFGPDAARNILADNNGQPPLNLRGDKEALEKAGLELAPDPFSPFGWEVTGGDMGTLSRLIAEGKAAPQDQSSLIAASLARGFDGAVLELCCGRGNKTPVLRNMLEGPIISGDLALPKLKQLRALSVPDNRQVCCDASRQLPFRRKFGFVFLDAPCSNMGTVRRHPELKYRRRPEDGPAFAELQSAILNGAAPFVDAGGALLYAVCSFETEETVQVAEGFRSRHPGFSYKDIGGHRPELKEAGLTEGPFLRIFPGMHGMDGFFAALLVKGN